MLTKAQRKHIIDLRDASYRRETGEFLIEGLHGVKEALDAGLPLKQLVIDENRLVEEPFKGFIAQAKVAQVPVTPINPLEAEKIQTMESFPGAFAVGKISPAPLELLFENGPVVVMDNINDPGNMGTIIRTADWFGVKNILVSNSCVDVHNPKVVRGSAGSLFHVTCHEASDIVAAVQKFSEQGYVVNALALGGKDTGAIKPSKKSLYIFGSEAHGIRPELLALASGIYTIPGKGRAESLNVAVAVGLVLQGIFE